MLENINIYWKKKRLFTLTKNKVGTIIKEISQSKRQRKIRKQHSQKH